jgi:hypothetical protein
MVCFIQLNCCADSYRYNVILDHCDETKEKYQALLKLHYSGNSTRTNNRILGKETIENLVDAATCAAEKLGQYYDISSEHSTIAVVLDPRHKLQFYEDESKSDDENAEERSRIVNQVREINEQQYSATAPTPAVFSNKGV